MATRLLVSDAEPYGDKFQEHLLEQYKLFVSNSLALSPNVAWRRTTT